jgi:subtilisin family serine protease
MKVLNVLLLVLFASSASALGLAGVEAAGGDIEFDPNENRSGNFLGIPELSGGSIPLEAVGGVIKDEYIVTYSGDAKPRGLLNGLIKSGRAEILNEYTLINGFSVRMNKKALQNALKHIEGVEIYDNAVMSAIAVQSPVQDPTIGSWGLDRVDQVSGFDAFDDAYHYERTGANVDVYILDTGITTENTYFEGRARFGYDTTGEGDGDGHGHGTHVAGTLH